jgi:WD40 repeat protein
MNIYKVCERAWPSPSVVRGTFVAILGLLVTVIASPCVAQGAGSSKTTSELAVAPVFAFSSDGSSLASSGVPGQISVVDLSDGTERVVATDAAAGPITGLAFSPDGRSLASADAYWVTFWDVASGQQLRAFAADADGAIQDLAFGPKGDFAVGRVAGASAIVWDLATDSQRTLAAAGDGVEGIALSADGRVLASRGGGARIRLWDVASGRQIRALDDPAGARVTDLALGPQGLRLATANEDASIALWNANFSRVQILSDHTDLVTQLAFSPTGRLLASGGRDHQVKLWRLPSDNELLSSPIAVGAEVTALSFSPDGKALAVAGADGLVSLWDVASGAGRAVQANVPVAGLAFSSDGGRLSILSDAGQVTVWDLPAEAQRLVVDLPGYAGGSLYSGGDPSAIAPEGEGSDQTTGTAGTMSTAATEAVGSQPQTEEQDRQAGIQQKVHSRSRLGAWKGITSLALSPSGQRVGSAHFDGSVRTWNDGLGELSAEAGPDSTPATGVAFTADGKDLISVGRDSEVRWWDATTGDLVKRSFGHEHPIRTAAASPAGDLVATAGEETRIMLWDAGTGKLKRVLNRHSDFVNGLAFSGDGKLLASAGADARVLVWNPENGRLMETLVGHTGEVNAVAFNRDNRLLASAGADGEVRLWDATTGQSRGLLAGHQGAVRTVAFSRKGNLLASAGEDGRILVWSIPAGKLVKVLPTNNGAINSLLFLSRGQLLSADESGQISEWNVSKGGKLKAVRPTKQPRIHRRAMRRSQGAVQEVSAVASIAAADNKDLNGTAYTGIVAAVGRLLDWMIPAANAASLPDPAQGPGGPILVITSPSATYGTYYAEILRNEGLNEFAVADISTVTPTVLNGYDLVVLAPTALTSPQVTMLSDWVNAGGSLIAMRPDPQLSNLLGLSATGSTLSEGYLLIDTSRAPGNGIVGQTIQFHGTADRYTLNGASAVAILYSDAAAPTTNPAVTLHDVGTNGGQAAAFLYDLATSIVYTRQGNPAWAEQERDGYAPIRSDDKFYGDAAADPQPDWVDLNKVGIPQADEQQRLLANLIIGMNENKKPLPRFWYFPYGKKAVVIMTGDDHANGGTAGRFDQFLTASPAGCAVDNWECVRGTSYMYPSTPLTDSQAATYAAEGFEVGLHLNTGCADFTPTQLEDYYNQQIAEFTSAFPSVPAPATQRHHCIAWSDWVTGAKVQYEHGIRLDTSYYFWPPSWVLNRPGFFNGSAMPMRFADLPTAGGALIDVYNAQTEMTDESGQTYPYTINTLLDWALGSQGYYGAFTINAHTDLAEIPEADAVLASASARAVPIVSSRQMMDWLDFRNGSSFGALTWDGSALSFRVVPTSGFQHVPTDGLEVLLPLESSAGIINAVTANGSPISYTTRVIKGLTYAAFTGAPGDYVATYAADTTAPEVTATSPVSDANAVGLDATVAATFSEAIDPSTVSARTFVLEDAGGNAVPATVTYDATAGTAALDPDALLSASTTYTVTLKGGSTDPRIKDLSGNALAADYTWTFTTGTGPSCPCTAWDATAIPTTASEADPNAVELGVRFKSDLNGYITGVRFYKGSSNTGTHTGSLWASDGTLLATATFTNEMASGWQQVDFASPVAITADTVYVASYHAPNGNYAADPGFFAAQGVDRVPIHFLQDGASGANGLYAYGSGGFPTESWNSSNYWVDVVFTTSPGVDSASPTVPANLTAVPAGTTSVNLSWAASTDNVGVTGYLLERCTGADCTDFTQFAAVTATNYLDTSGELGGLIPGATYRYRVRAIDAAGNQSGYSNVASATTLSSPDTTPPTAPTNLTATASSATQISLSWTASTDDVGVSGYQVERCQGTACSNFAEIATSTSTTYSDSGLPAGTTYQYRVRAADAAGNFSSYSNVASAATQAEIGCSGATIWPSSAVPATVSDPDTGAVELGVKFSSDTDGWICGLRFYKGSANTGTHVGSLWTASGTLLGQATFTDETASGWQQVQFASPVAIVAGTTYVASYHASNGHYSADSGYFASALDNPPLHALQDGVGGGNGLYTYGPGGFPTSTYDASNYWVDVVFTANTGPDTTPPTVAATTPSDGAANIGVTAAVTATFNEPVDPTTVSASTFVLQGSGISPVAAAVSYDAASRTATLSPTSSLALDTTYTATIKGGDTDPRVKDLAGNALAADVSWTFTTIASDPCAAPANPIVAENCLPGNPPSEWDISSKDAGDSSIQGFATDISVNQGDTVDFKVDTQASNWRLDIYRMGYYGGMGARKVATINGTGAQNQPDCAIDSPTGLVDCGNWNVSASWSVPTDATSGIYFAKAVRADTGGASHIFFIVRDDASDSDILFQTSDTTWQAYNQYGGVSLYYGDGPGGGYAPGRAYKVSYNRPFYTRDPAPTGETETWVFNAEYPMVRWLEANGYDVTYFTGVDADRNGALIENHKVWMSNGHDEYWSGNERTNVEAARDAGVNLAFFSGNTMFWKTRWENAIDGSDTPYRTLVCYKETHENAVIDPADPPIWTGTWRDPRFSPPADGGKPENATIGTLFFLNGSYPDPITVTADDGKMRFWRNTSVANLGAGQSATLAPETLGAEVDVDEDNGFRPAGLIGLSTTPIVTDSAWLTDYGSTYNGAGSGTHRLTLYKAPSGALVFATGTYQWSWGLDSNHDRSSNPPDPRMQQATVNLFADMGAQPATLQSELTPAVASTDVTPPTSTIVSPTAGSTLPLGGTVTVSGTATDSGGGVVGGVEVSVDGGATWHPATSRGSWTYVWTPTSSGIVNIRSRAADDSANLEMPGPGMNIAIGSSLTSIEVTPANPAIQVGSTQQFTATGTYSDGSTQNLTSEVTWTSSSSSVATIDAAGLGRGVGPGQTTISASFGGVNGDTALSVAGVAPTLTSIGVTPANPTIQTGGTQQFTATGSYSDGSTQDLTSQVTWGSSATTVATVSTAGLATGLGAGSCTVSATLGSVSGGTTLTVEAAALAITTGSLADATVGAAYSATLTATGGTPSYTWSITTGSLPAGLSLDTTTGLIGGTPTASGTSSFTVQVTDATSLSVTKSLSIAVAATPTALTIWPSTALPGLIDGGADNPVELGVKFRSDVAGTITGIRFYKASTNTGTHVANLWSSTGTLVATATFTNETASGWQQVNFATPVAISADTVYVASYHATSGHYSADIGYFASNGADNASLHALADGVSGGNGVYVYGASSAFPHQTWNSANYWVDVVFYPGSAPTLQSIAVIPANPSIPTGGTQQFMATGTYSDGSTQDLTSQVTWGTSSTTVATISPAGLAKGLTTGSSAISATLGSVSGSATLIVQAAPLTITTVSLADATVGAAYSATLAATGGTPSYTWSVTTGILPAGLSLNTTTGLISGTPTASSTPSFTVKVTDGANLSVTKSLSITVAATPTALSIWPSTAMPALVDGGPDGAVELGVKFRSDMAGTITGIRFYKASTNTGTHVANLWSSTGTLLATATFTNETGSGWQQVDFAGPVAISANTVYVASYHALNGHYSADVGYFASNGVDNTALHALADGVAGGNGVYAYGASSAFPNQTWNSANYWVDVVFYPGP